MALINQLGNEIPDRWIYPQAGEQGAFEAYRIASFDLLRDRGAMPDDARPSGIVLQPETSPELVAPFLDRIDLVVIPFPKFRDGRGFTTARSLRQRHGFKGDIRAIGHILPDQLPLLAQCGFTSIVTPAEHPPAQWQTSPGGIAAGNRPQPLLQRLVKRGN